MKFFVFIALCILFFEKAQLKSLDLSKVLLNQTRRTLRGSEVDDTRPYMVYLRPSEASRNTKLEINWLCGGVIISAQFVLTSAACTEQKKNFYIISGTHRWLPLGNEDECIKNGAKKAVLKCVPTDNEFDIKEFWPGRKLVNDIAVVKVEDDFNFERRIQGCDFIPKVIAFNNCSEDLETPGSSASIAGWGSIESFGDAAGTPKNPPELLVMDVILMFKKKCKPIWSNSYHNLIDSNMVCAKEKKRSGSDSMNAVRRDQRHYCKKLVDSDEYGHGNNRRYILNPDILEVHSSNHLNVSRRSKIIYGGAHENDHGVPLVAGHGKDAVVIGIMSACAKEVVTHICYGPYLFTSVWRYRHFISCAINKENGPAKKRSSYQKRNQFSETKDGNNKNTN